MEYVKSVLPRRRKDGLCANTVFTHSISASANIAQKDRWISVKRPRGTSIFTTVS